MFVSVDVQAKSIALLTLVPSSDDLERPNEVLSTTNGKMETDTMTMEFLSLDKNEQIVNFNVVDKKSGSANTFDFGLKYWVPFQTTQPLDADTPCNSGAYIFRSSDNHFYPLVYADFLNSTIAHGKDTSRMTFFFGKTNQKTGEVERQAIVYVTLDKHFGAMKFDVDLNSLPIVRLNGYEVMVHFQAHGFENSEGAFYTDSNGLKMQKRTLNKRDYFDEAKYNHGVFNISSNFYPINSALSVFNEDKSKQFTVMNDRSQAGASLYPGNIQLMQNRRLSADDNKGVDQFLNETDAFGQGIRIYATYYVQLFDTASSTSLQRQVQQYQADPLQVFYTDKVVPAAASGNKYDMTWLSGQLAASGVSGTVKMNAFASQANEILLRFENLADDTIDEWKSTDVSIEDIVTALWKSQNGDDANYSVDWTEMNLSGTLPISDTIARHLHWRTVDDTPGVPPPVREVTGKESVITLEPQQIAMYKAVYTPKAALLQ